MPIIEKKEFEMNGKPHPHAELIKQMVDDDTLRATYGDGWHECGSDSVIFYPTRDWHLVQPKPNTITIVANGKTYELPEPMRAAPEDGANYYIAHSSTIGAYKWFGDSINMISLRQGICHATREAAQSWVDAMAEIRGAK